MSAASTGILNVSHFFLSMGGMCFVIVGFLLLSLLTDMASNSYSFSCPGSRTAEVLPVTSFTFLVLVNAGTRYRSHVST